MIRFNVPPLVGTELHYMEQATRELHICGDGTFTKRCNAWLEERMNAPRVMLTTSGTSALDMSALLCDIQPGDEVILPSYTFSSTATSFALRGAKLVFIDIRPDTMNMDETKIEAAITDKTRVIIPVHYAGVACEMDTIMRIAREHKLLVVEDAAQGIMSTYKGKALGTIGDLGCYSFHETKNLSMGEGGAIVINNTEFIERAEIIREKGTDRTKFRRGQVDKYTWVDIGDSFLPSELNAAFLWAQLEKVEEIQNSRMNAWNIYDNLLKNLSSAGIIGTPYIPNDCVHNAHMYYVKLKGLAERDRFISYLKDRKISSVFHYVPLHSSPAGLKYGRFVGADQFTTRESDRLTRLPMYYNIEEEDVYKTARAIEQFFS